MIFLPSCWLFQASDVDSELIFDEECWDPLSQLAQERPKVGAIALAGHGHAPLKPKSSRPWASYANRIRWEAELKPFHLEVIPGSMRMKLTWQGPQLELGLEDEVGKPRSGFAPIPQQNIDFHNLQDRHTGL